MFSDLVSNTLRKFQEKKVMYVIYGKQGKSVLFAYGFSSSTYILGRLSTSLISFPFFFLSKHEVNVYSWLAYMLIKVIPLGFERSANKPTLNSPVLSSAQLDDTLIPFVCQIMLLQPWTTEMIRFGN
jgi:hypothetical protein